MARRASTRLESLGARPDSVDGHIRAYSFHALGMVVHGHRWDLPLPPSCSRTVQPSSVGCGTRSQFRPGVQSDGDSD
jgi:hypothetical protein